MPFDEQDKALLAITFDTKLMTTCYIGQGAWRDVIHSSHKVLHNWIDLGLDPSGRKVKAVRIFKQNKNFHSFYQLDKVIYLMPSNPNVRAEREQLIGMQETLIDPFQHAQPAAEAVPASHGRGYAWDDPGLGTHVVRPPLVVPHEWPSDNWVAHPIDWAHRRFPQPVPDANLTRAIEELRAGPVPDLVSQDIWDKVYNSLHYSRGSELVVIFKHLTGDQLKSIINNFGKLLIIV